MIRVKYIFEIESKILYSINLSYPGMWIRSEKYFVEFSFLTRVRKPSHFRDAENSGPSVYMDLYIDQGPR